MTASRDQRFLGCLWDTLVLCLERRVQTPRLHHVIFLSLQRGLSPSHRPGLLARIANACPSFQSPVHYVPGPQLSHHPTCLDSHSLQIQSCGPSQTLPLDEAGVPGG